MVDLIECLAVDVRIGDAKCIEYIVDARVVISGEDRISGENILLAGIVELLWIAVESSSSLGSLEQLGDRIGVACLCVFVFQRGADGGFIVLLCRIVGVGRKEVVIIIRNQKLCHLRDGRIEVHGMSCPCIDPEVVVEIDREGLFIACGYAGQCGIKVFAVVCITDRKVRIF